MSLVVGLDVGTQSVKLLAYDADAAQVAALHGQPLELVARDDGTREQEAQWWIEAIRACFARLDPALRARVTAIGVSGQQHGFVPLDAAGRVLAPVKLWCDTSTQRECDEIMQALGGESACVEAAGNPILAGYTASKLAWLRKHRPEAYRGLATVLLPHDYVNFWLTGERWMECGDASGTGWFDVRRRAWSPQVLRAIDPERDLGRCLPPLADAGATFPLAPAIADELGLPRTVRVSVGGGDNMMAAIGTGNVVPGRLTMSLGTSGTLFAFADRPVVDPQAGWAAFCASSDGWLPLICTMNCTVATELAARLFGLKAQDAEALLAQTAPGAGGVLLLPFFNGERTPNLPGGRGALFGLDPLNTAPANVYRAAMEGATYSLRHGYDAFVAAGLRFERICLTGGGSNSPAWRQMVADVFELPVEVPEQSEGAAFGAALQALWASQRARGGASLAELAQAHVRMRADRAAAPDPERAAAYRIHYRRFLRHLDAVRPLYAA
ncbi:xylulokinase [Vulcaniibacterium tengchongense]|uniref:Xylulose kinase n=1 Tax=Vulcaniibacterium tengchongense TaxID=1273429 RepID=A0A3N4VPR9_9GAMM|nr:xylulokinase [Vulcaniibacterium tengchongense]RPE81201.1 xylulokinase [Vulcaniibacterium tengchongense]